MREYGGMVEIDMWELKPGDVVILYDGSRARVKMPSIDGQWILVEYLVSADVTARGDNLVTEDELAAVEVAAPDTLE
jgi:hypothetical protein